MAPLVQLASLLREHPCCVQAAATLRCPVLQLGDRLKTRDELRAEWEAFQKKQRKVGRQHLVRDCSRQYHIRVRMARMEGCVFPSSVCVRLGVLRANAHCARPASPCRAAHDSCIRHAGCWLGKGQPFYPMQG